VAKSGYYVGFPDLTGFARIAARVARRTDRGTGRHLLIVYCRYWFCGQTHYSAANPSTRILIEPAINFPRPADPVFSINIIELAPVAGIVPESGRRREPRLMVYSIGRFPIPHDNDP
jgi:hypothetical protein